MISIIVVGNNKVFAGMNYSKTNWLTFNSKWEYVVYIKYSDGESSSNCAKMVFGFDTYAIDEDFCWTYGYTQRTQASLTNGNGTFAASKANVSRWSRVEKIHSGKVVEYRIWVSEKYMGVSTVEKSTRKIGEW